MNTSTANPRRLLAAGFTAIVASGVGFSIRGGILIDWGAQFGFTQTELGRITGGGLVGFGMVIIVGAFLAEAVGYGRLMITAFVCHLLSAVLTLAATPLYAARVSADPIAARSIAYQCLYWGMFLFAVGNGICEAVVNPLTAALFPKQKTHYLNILHAGWPAGLVLGGLASALLAGKVRWEIQMSLFLAPVLVYGVMCIGQYFPRSEARAKGITLGRMFLEFVSPLLLLLLLAQALVGYVELGTDSWISNITGNILQSKTQGLYLFVYVSVLDDRAAIFRRADHSSDFAIGAFVRGRLFRLRGADRARALATFGVCPGRRGDNLRGGKDLPLADHARSRFRALSKRRRDRHWRGGSRGDAFRGTARHPRHWLPTGSVCLRGITREVAGCLRAIPGAHARTHSCSSNTVRGLDGAKVNPIRTKPALERTDEERAVHEADLLGGRMALRATAVVPATLALLYLSLLLYFKAIGGYRPLHVDEEPGLPGSILSPAAT